MGILERILEVVYKYRVLTIFACLLSVYTCSKLILGAMNVDYFTLIPIPLMLIAIFGYLGIAVITEKEPKRLLYTVVNIGMCAIALMYFPFINNIGDIPIIKI